MTTSWHGCYDGGWGDLITPESFAHPAKFARGLIERIVRHGLERGYWHKGDVIGDPFGGVALGGVVATYHGLAWVGVELEGKFVALGNDNIDLHRQKLEALGAPIPVLLQGDSRNFAEIVQGAAGICTSPPYADSDQNYAGGFRRVNGDAKRKGKQADASYGSSPGQIAALPPGDLQAVVTSPPFEASLHDAPSAGILRGSSARPGAGARQVDGYGTTEGQIGKDSGDSYWKAMHQVYDQCLKALRPGGVMAVVVKRYVKNKQIVPISDQTLELLLHLGFQPLERVQAMLVKESTAEGLFVQKLIPKAQP